MKREIVMFGSQVLRQPCPPVENIDEDIRVLVGDLFDSMRAAEGVGLAAPQIGVLQRVCIVDVSTQQPEHLPNLYGDVKRYSWVEVEATDINGETFKTAGEGFYARALQHEIDHLNGKLFIDYLSSLKKQLMRGALKRLKKEGEVWDHENR